MRMFRLRAPVALVSEIHDRSTQIAGQGVRSPQMSETREGARERLLHEVLSQCRVTRQETSEPPEPSGMGVIGRGNAPAYVGLRFGARCITASGCELNGRVGSETVGEGV